MQNFKTFIIRSLSALNSAGAYGRILFFAFVLTTSNASAFQQIEKDNVSDLQAGEEVTSYVYELLRDSTVFVGDRYWWLDCPDMLSFSERGGDAPSESQEAITNECLSSKAFKEYDFELASAIQVGGYHRDGVFFAPLSEKISQFANLDSLRETFSIQGWECSQIESRSDGTALSFSFSFYQVGEHDETILNTICKLNFQHRYPAYLLRLMGLNLNRYDRTSTGRGEWALSIAARSFYSTPFLVDSTAHESSRLSNHE